MPDLAQALAKMPEAQRAKVIATLTPRIVEPYIAHIPHPKQQVFLTLQAREAMYGGAAGGGKSDAILMAALQYVDVPGYSALILRRTWPDLNASGAILDRAKSWLEGTDAVIRDGGRIITFPSGAKLQFGYLGRDADKYKYQSAEYQFIGFDELTHFEESSYRYLFSRLRKPQLACLTCGGNVRKYKQGWIHTERKERVSCKNLFPDPAVIEQYPGAESDGTTVFDVPLRMRSASNPGGVGHEWVGQRFVFPETREPKAVFIPAKLNDNPSLDRTAYRESLSHLSIIDRQRLEDGDWSAMDSGDFFERGWWRLIDKPTFTEKEPRLCRYWDMAATDGGGDWTASVLLAHMPDGTWEIRDIWRGQVSDAKQEQIIQQFAKTDGQYVPIRMEQEPGSAGKNLISYYARNVLYGTNFDGVRSTGTKTDRAYPVKVAAERGHIKLVINNFTRDFLNEADAFPGGNNDDMVDALSGAMEFLGLSRQGRLLV